jgi:hypothetical protein
MIFNLRSQKGEIVMRWKASGLLVVLIVCGLIGLIGCVQGKGRNTQAKNDVSGTESKVSNKEWKTYVSKYGFSVSYPRSWFLQEDKDPIGRKEGCWPFDIYNYHADHPKKEPGVSINFNFYDNAVSYLTSKGLKMPENPYEKILFLSDKCNIYKNNSKNAIKRMNINGIDMVLIYYEGKTPWQALFYLPKEDAMAIVGLESEYGTKEYLLVLNTIKTME